MNLKYLAIFIVGATMMALLTIWLAMNKIFFTVVFSVAAMDPHNWIYVMVNFVLLSVFLVFTVFRGRVAKLPSSIYLAFIVALYIEMYGFALTWFAVSALLGLAQAATFWGLLLPLTGLALLESIFYFVIVPISNIIILAGIFLVVFGWGRIFRAKDKLVTTGIYAQIRHPQYLGFLLITGGINFLWPTLSTLLMWPILMFVYFRQAKEEEAKMQEEFGEEFQKYKERVPIFMPHLSNESAK